MMLDTNGDIFPEGTYQFRVATVPEETDVKGYKGWQWSFEAETDEGIRTYNERFMVWLLAPLLRGLQFEELAPGKFDFEPTEALNRTFTATITHVTIEKGASAGKIVARMQNIVSKAKMNAAYKAAMKAQSTVGKVEEDIPF